MLLPSTQVSTRIFSVQSRWRGRGNDILDEDNNILKYKKAMFLINSYGDYNNILKYKNDMFLIISYGDYNNISKYKNDMFLINSYGDYNNILKYKKLANTYGKGKPKNYRPME